MEALRLLSGGAATSALPALAAQHNLLNEPLSGTSSQVPVLPAISSDTWDAALFQTHLGDLFPGSAPTVLSSPAGTGTGTASDPAALQSGLAQLDKYLNRAWYRAGIPVQMHEDCSQAVYTTMLQQVGRARFDAMISDVGQHGIRDVFSRETNEGLDFFRAVDMVKKRAQRERAYLSLDAVDVPASNGSAETSARSDALREAIAHSLSPREASLITDTLMGKTPAEIAHHWGVAPKTISNEKSRVIQKLRDVLLSQSMN